MATVKDLVCPPENGPEVILLAIQSSAPFQRVRRTDIGTWVDSQLVPPSGSIAIRDSR